MKSLYRIALFLGLLVVLAIFWAYLTARTDGGKTLVFELDREPPTANDDPRLIEAVQKRIGAINGSGIVVRPAKTAGRLEVIVPGRNTAAATAAEMERVKELVERTGRLEFLILANDYDDQEAIAAAMALINNDLDPNIARQLEDRQVNGLPPPGPVGPDAELSEFSIVLADGQKSVVTYRWVEIGSQQVRAFGLDVADKNDPIREFLPLRREMAEKPNRAMQLIDPGDPTGRKFLQGALLFSRECKSDRLSEEQRRQKQIEYFVLARSAEIDPETGKPTPSLDGAYLAAVEILPARDDLRGVSFTLNDKGAQLLTTLSRKNIPSATRPAQTKRHLAIVLDGQMMLAPILESEIGAEAQITGMFRDSEIEQLADILRSGPLPVGLRLISVSDFTPDGEAHGEQAARQAPAASIKQDHESIQGMWQRVAAKGDDGKTGKQIRLDFKDDNVLVIRHVMEGKEKFLLNPFELKEVEGKRVIFLDNRKWASYRLTEDKLVLEDGTLDLPGGAVSLKGEWQRCRRLEDDTVQKAVKAHGGRAGINKLRIGRVTFSMQGSFPFLPGADELDINVEETYQLPRHQIKKVITGKVDGKDIALTWAIDGDRHWYREKGGKTELMDERLDTESQYRPFLMLERMVDRDTRWTVPEEFAKKTGGIVFRATSASTRFEATYSFDEATGLLASIQSPVLLPGQLAASQEWKLSDYREIDGVTLPMKQVLSRNSKRLAEIQIREVQFFDKLDLEVFAAPR